jgi:hypothetical protein
MDALTQGQTDGRRTMYSIPELAKSSVGLVFGLAHDAPDRANCCALRCDPGRTDDQPPFGIPTSATCFSRRDLMSFAHHDHSFTEFNQAVVVDLETTGSDPKSVRILRIACLRGSIADLATRGFTQLDQFTARLHPGILFRLRQAVSAASAAIIPLRTRRLRISQPGLREFIGALPLIGRNVRFDEAFLSEEFNRAGHNSL